MLSRMVPGINTYLFIYNNNIYFQTGVPLKVAVFDVDPLNSDDFIDILFKPINFGSAHTPARNRASAHSITEEITGKENTK